MARPNFAEVSSGDEMLMEGTMFRRTALQQHTSAAQPTFHGQALMPSHRPHSISSNAMENLWVRLKAGSHLRPRVAQMLRQLDVPPFKDTGIYELSASGYVVAVGMPGEAEQIDDGALLQAFETRYGVPVSFSGVLRHKVIS